MMRVVAFVCLLLAVVSAEGKKSYRGYQVFSVKADTAAQVNTLNELATNNPDVIFLGHPTTTRATELAVPPHLTVGVVGALRAAELSVEILSADMQAGMDAVMAENEMNEVINNQTGPQLRNGRYSPAHNVYHTMDSVNSIMLNLANAYPELAVRKALPYLSEEEGETIYYMEIGTAGSNKPVIFIEGLAHAREWIVTASLIYTMDQMLLNYDESNPNSEATRNLNKYTWVIIPVVNPDGYRYTWTNNRMWRKNRKYISNVCSGVDLNRNFNVNFAQTGASSNCRTDTYHGGSAFSEAETQNIAQLFNNLKDRVAGFLSVHAYSQLLLHPWGYTSPTNSPGLTPPNLSALISLGRQMKTALDSNGRTYQLGTAYGVLGYAASGASEDWALQEKPGIYAYCYELRPASFSAGGFDIPQSEIVPTGTELLRSLYVMGDGM